MNISRIICGGNLISGYAHSRDLIYLSSLLKKYFSDERIMETWRICEQQGINTMICYPEDKHAIEVYEGTGPGAARSSTWRRWRRPRKT